MSHAAVGIRPSRARTHCSLVTRPPSSRHGLREGKVTIRGFEKDGIVTVQVIDTGAKLKLWEPDEAERNEGLGLLLIKNLISDLGGTFTLQHSVAGSSTLAEVRFPLVHSRA